MIKPNVFMLGAPKCGTTSLASYLADHDRIFVSNPKEPAFFEDVNIRGVGSWKEYNAVFREAEDRHQVVMDASTGYLHSEFAVDKILGYQPDAKFIVAIRNPIDMCVSLHGQAVRGNYAHSKSLEESLKYATSLDLLGSPTPKQKYLQNYIDRCRLGTQCVRLLDKVDRERVLFVLFDDIKCDTGKVYRDVLTFLDLPDDGRSEFPVENAGFLIKYDFINKVMAFLGVVKRKVGLHKSLGLASRLQRMNSKGKDKVNTGSAFPSQVKEVFKEEIMILEEAIGRDLGCWNADVD